MMQMKLRHLAEIQNSNVDKVIVEGEQPVRLCNYVDVYKNDFITADMEFNAGSATPAEIDRFSVKVGDVIITKDSEDRQDIGIPAFVRETADDLVCGYHLTMLRAFKSRAYGAFLFWALQSKPAKEAFAIAANGVTRYGLTQEGIKGLPIWVPDLPTQKRIAAFLDRETARIDELIAKKERLVEVLGERLNTRRNVAFRQIHSSQYRPLRWLLAQICDGPFGSGLTSAHYTENGVRVIRLQNIKDGGFDGTDTAFISEEHYASLGDHDVNSGDLLVAGLGDEKNRVGRACIAPDNLGPAMVKADCYRIRLNPKLIAHSFTAEYLCSDESWAQIYALAKGVTRSRLNLELVRRIRIPVPSLEKQREIIAGITKERLTFTTVSDRVTTSIDRLREYRAALITSAVTGQIDVDTYGKTGTTSATLDKIEEELHG